MSGLLEELNVDIFNLYAIECLEELGLTAPTQTQIDIVELFLRCAAQIGNPKSLMKLLGKVTTKVPKEND